MKKFLLIFPILASLIAKAQCNPDFVALSMNIYTDNWGYETYWELVPGTNDCGDGTIAWGSNIETVGCSGGGEQNAGGSATAYPNNTVITVADICLAQGELYTLYFVDDYGDGGLYFEMFQDGNLTGVYQGTGAGNSWTFEAGLNPLGPHDSPCSALEVLPQIGQAVDLSNANCYAQINEITPFLGHCRADGAWCNDPVQHSVWASFTVPDDGSYQISTVHYGTAINTQLAVWYAEDCADPSSFILLSANDDHWGDADLPVCNANPPVCVNTSSAAYLNVMQTFPECCTNGWDENCQALYDSFSETCVSEIGCTYTLRGFDTYGDGWNDCIVVVNINGTQTNYSMAGGSYEEWQIPITDGDNISLSFITGGWPEEVFIQLVTPYNQMVYDGAMLNLSKDFFSTTATCIAPLISNPFASRCYVHCLPPGVTCYIQIDGYNNETGSIVLSVEPYLENPTLMTEQADLICPVTIGVPSQAYIVTHVEGWGLYHDALWTGPNEYSSTDFHIGELQPGDYHVTFADGCDQTIEANVEIGGPQPFILTTNSSSSCPFVNDGTIDYSIAGGTAPYEVEWQFPDGTTTEDPDLDNLYPGQYFMIIEDANYCSIMAPVQVETLSNPMVDLGADITVCNDFAIALFGPDNYIDYSWSTGANTQSVNLSYEDFPEGIYTITLTVTDSYGCTNSDDIQLNVESCISVDEKANSISIYPNPASTYLLLDGEVSSYRLYNAFGQLIDVRQELNYNTTIDVQQFNNGVYYLHIVQNEHKLVLPLLIQH